MAYKTKAEQEKEFVNMILAKGGVIWSCCMAEGKNDYFKMELKNGETRYWKNFSIESLERLGMKEWAN